MLRLKSAFVCLAVFGFAATSHAASGSMNINRGGVGFLFPDHNSFANAGQFALARGMGLQFLYGTSTAGSPTQLATPTFVFGNGNVGFGVYGLRSGTNLSSGYSQSVGGALGFALAKGRLTLGASYDKSLDAGASIGTIKATLTMNPAGRKGVAIGAAYTGALDGTSNGVDVGLGYQSGMHAFEANVNFPAINLLGNFTLGAYFTTMSGPVYLAGGYQFTNVDFLGLTGARHGVKGRLGVTLGKSVDLSVTADTYFVTGAPINYGGTLRFVF